MLTEADCKRDYDGKFKKLSDGQGLQLWVQPNGKRFWRSAFRIGGKQKVLALGQFPIVSRSDAREANRHVKMLLASGLDPVKEKRDRRTALAGAVTFGKMADEFIVLKKKNNRAEATLKKTEWLLDIAKRKLGPMALNDIRPSDIWALLEKIQTRNRFETARRMRITIGGVFRLAIATDRAVIDPTFALRGALACPKAVSHAAITDPREFGALLRAIDGFDGQPTTVTALKLMALLFQRPGELRRAELTEFDFENAIWTIPAGRMKMRREHKVPLSKQAMQIIKDLMGVIADGKYLFPSVRTPTKPISENTLNAALRRLGYAQDEHTSHG